MNILQDRSKAAEQSNTILPQEAREISNNQTLQIKRLMKEQQQNKPKVSRRKEIKNQRRNKWNRDKENNSKDQWD